VLNSHNDIVDSAVIGVPSEVGEEEVKACIVLRPGKKLEPEQLMKFCEDRLAYFMIPRYVEFVDNLPMTQQERSKNTSSRRRIVREHMGQRKAATSSRDRRPRQEQVF